MQREVVLRRHAPRPYVVKSELAYGASQQVPRAALNFALEFHEHQLAAPTAVAFAANSNRYGWHILMNGTARYCRPFSPICPLLPKTRPPDWFSAR